MRWLKRRQRRTPQGGQRAHHAAEMNLQAQLAQWPDVIEVAASLREQRERNHFAEKIDHVFRSRR